MPFFGVQENASANASRGRAASRQVWFLQGVELLDGARATTELPPLLLRPLLKAAKEAGRTTAMVSGRAARFRCHRAGL